MEWRRRRLEWPTLAAHTLLVAFFASEAALRKGAAARTLHAEATDQGSTRLLGVAYTMAGTLALITARSTRTRLPHPLRWAGVAMMGAGIELRVVATGVLGASYGRTLRVEAHQSFVQTGPYARVRHPGYTGSLGMWLGYGISLGKVWSVLAAVAPPALAYSRRIWLEEAMLQDAFGDPYRAYRSSTPPLLPRLHRLNAASTQRSLRKRWLTCPGG